MEHCDLALLVGNRFTLETFPSTWHPKIRLLNYGVDTQLYGRRLGIPRRNEFCYAATNCGLRKGFMDVLRTWSGIPESESRLHAIGEIEPPWDHLLTRYNNGSIVAHGWIDSRDDGYLRILQSCRFAYIPTYEEGQMGTLLEAIYSGCVPITTRASGLDERVLGHCVIVEPLDIEGHREAIRSALAWSDGEYEERQAEVLDAARTHQSWEAFESGLNTALADLRVHAG
jgi:glycosyltransferase involved in cell wall biosynthesis